MPVTLSSRSTSRSPECMKMTRANSMREIAKVCGFEGITQRTTKADLCPLIEQLFAERLHVPPTVASELVVSAVDLVREDPTKLSGIAALVNNSDNTERKTKRELLGGLPADIKKNILYPMLMPTMPTCEKLTKQGSRCWKAQMFTDGDQKIDCKGYCAFKPPDQSTRPLRSRTDEAVLGLARAIQNQLIGIEYGNEFFPASNVHVEWIQRRPDATRGFFKITMKIKGKETWQGPNSQATLKFQTFDDIVTSNILFGYGIAYATVELLDLSTEAMRLINKKLEAEAEQYKRTGEYKVFDL